MDSTMRARPKIVSDSHLEYLDRLRESGEVNMFRAALYLSAAFGLEKKDARTILTYWMQSFGERHPQKETA